MSETPMISGFSLWMTQVFGDIVDWHSVKAYSPSMVLSGLTPDASCMIISTLLAVLSSIFLILIFPLLLASTMLSISLSVVVPQGISLMTRVLLSSLDILARIFSLPPRLPSLYFETSILPPVGKSGYRTKSSFFR